MQHVARVQRDLVEGRALRGEPGVQRRDARFVDGDRQEPARAGRVAPVRHHVTDVQMRRNRFDLGDDDRVALPLARDLHRPAGVQRKPHRILVRDRDDMVVFVDEHVFRERADAREQALAIGQRRCRRFRLMRGAARAVGEPARKRLRLRHSWHCRDKDEQRNSKLLPHSVAPSFFKSATVVG